MGRDVAQAAAPRAQKDGILVQGNNRIAISKTGGDQPPVSFCAAKLRLYQLEVLNGWKGVVEVV